MVELDFEGHLYSGHWVLRRYGQVIGRDYIRTLLVRVTEHGITTLEGYPVYPTQRASDVLREAPRR